MFSEKCHCIKPPALLAFEKSQKNHRSFKSLEIFEICIFKISENLDSKKRKMDDLLDSDRAGEGFGLSRKSDQRARSPKGAITDQPAPMTPFEELQHQRN